MERVHGGVTARCWCRFRFHGARRTPEVVVFTLGSPRSRPYKRRAMSHKAIDVCVKIFLVLLIGFFATAVWGVLGMIGVV